MKKVIKRLLLSGLLGLLLGSTAQGQTDLTKVLQATNITALQQISTEVRQEAEAAYAAAYGIALLNNWPIREELEDGRIIQLIRLDDNGNPLYYTTTNANAAMTTRTDRVQVGGGAGLSLSGDGMVIGEWDGGTVRGTHQELTGRVTQMDTPVGISDHATHVCGTLVGTGLFSNAKGMAPEATVRAYDFFDDLPEMAIEASNGLLVSNHSYGFVLGWNYDGVDENNNNLWTWTRGTDTYNANGEDLFFGKYVSNTATWDQIAYNAPYYLMVKSAGNDRSNNPGNFPPVLVRDGEGGTYEPYDANNHPSGDGEINNGYDSMSSQGCAKNILTVGAVDDVLDYTGANAVTMSSFSGWGPTDDGRIKPDVVGNGVGLTSTSGTADNEYYATSGTSMSSPNVAGSCLLLQEHYEETHGTGNFMRSATLKALVIHTADEAGAAEGPDYQYGWGLMNTERAAEVITEDVTNTTVISENTLNNGSTFTTDITSDGTQPLTITIAWTDPEAITEGGTLDSATPKLVNDLDIRLSDGTATFLPYILDTATPAAAATTGDNTRDNVEKIYLAAPSVGDYTLTVSHKGSLNGGQDYSLIVTGEGEEVIMVDCWVTNTNDSGSGSLRETINCVNSDPELDVIGFNIVGNGPHRIVLESNLPNLSDEGIVIDGTTQPNWELGDIIIDGKFKYYGFSNINSSNCQIYGIHFTKVISGITFGEAPNCRIGRIGKGNIINHSGTGIYCHSTKNAESAIIEGNLIGVDLSGTIVKTVSGYGISIAGNSKNMQILNNVISGCNEFAISISFNLENELIIANNYLGTDISGNLALSNGGGIDIVPRNCGGSCLTEVKIVNNVISGNLGHGIRTPNFNNNDTQWIIKGNKIGTDVSGTLPLGNKEWGIRITHHNFEIGGVEEGERNIIAYNELGGIYFQQNSSIKIRLNSIFCNGGNGILGGANSVNIHNASENVIEGTSSSNAKIDIYLSSYDLCPDNSPQGEIYIGTTDANSSGEWQLQGNFSDGRYTATATGISESSSTSNFSNYFILGETCDLRTSISSEATYCGNADGTASVVAMGGSNNYFYNWNTGQTTATIENLQGGEYYVTVNDGICQSIKNVFIENDNSPSVLIEKNYGGTNRDQVYSIDITNDGGYIFAGHTVSSDIDITDNNSGAYINWVFKTSSAGEIEWSKTYDGFELGRFGGVAPEIRQTSDGGYIYSTYTRDNAKQGLQVLKLDGIGNIEWEYIPSSSIGWVWGTSVVETQSGDYVFTGSKGNRYFDVIKLNSTGEVVWERQYGGSNPDIAESLKETLDGGFIVTGRTHSSDGDVTNNHASSEGWVIKLDKDGYLEWSKSLGGYASDELVEVIQTSTGDYIFVGKSNSRSGDIPFNLGETDGWVIKLNSNGDILWSKIFGSEKIEELYSIIEVDNGYIVSGLTGTSLGQISSANTNAWIFKIDDEGNQIWSKILNNPGYNSANDIIQNQDGKLVLAGISSSNNGSINNNYGETDAWIVELSPQYLPIVDLGDNQTIQLGETIQLDGTDPNCVGCTYIWDDGETNPDRNVSPNETTTYFLTVTSESSCTTYDEITINVTEPIEFIIKNYCESPNEITSIPICVKNFAGVSGFQYSIHIPSNVGILADPPVSNLTLPNLSEGDFTRIDDYTLTLTWEANDVIEGETLTDGTSIYHIDVQLNDQAGSEGNTYIDGNPTPIEVVQGLEVVDAQFEEGLVCINSTVELGGQVWTYYALPIPNVNMDLTGDISQSETTDANGTYLFSALNIGSTLTLTPNKNGTPENGVTISDVTRIKGHIRQVMELEFDSPYQYIAADVNNSGTVSILDVVFIKQVIGQDLETFPINKSWRFIPADYQFPDPANPFSPAFPESKNYAPLNQNELSEDFIGVKIGDVNETVDLSQFDLENKE